LKARADEAWSCPKCGTSDPLLRYLSGKIRQCKDCQGYDHLVTNSKIRRKRRRSPDLHITHAEFLAWIRATDRCCTYCRIPDHRVIELGLMTSIGLPLEKLGVDRVDNDRDYEISNVVLSCYACNKVKGNVFTYEEMLTIGRAIQAAWEMRLSVPPCCPVPGRRPQRSSLESRG
jgi:hypothetical protein